MYLICKSGTLYEAVSFCFVYFNFFYRNIYVCIEMLLQNKYCFIFIHFILRLWPQNIAYKLTRLDL